MSFSNVSMDVPRPAAYSLAHRSEPRRARASRSACCRRSSHRLVDDRGTCTFSHGVPSAQNPRRPGVISLEYRRRGERNQRVHERKLVPELPDVREAFTHHRDRIVRVSAPHRKNGTKIAHQRQEPRTGVSKRQCRLLEQAFRLFSIAGHERDPRQPSQRTPSAPWDRQRSELFNGCG